MITNVEIVVVRKSRSSFAEMSSAESGCGSPKLNRVCGFSKERPVRKSIGQKVPVRRSSSEDQAGQEFYRSIFGYHYTKRHKPSCFRCYFTDSRIAPRTPFPRTLFQPFTLAPTHRLIPEPTAASRNAGRGLKWRVPRRSHSGVGHTAASQNHNHRYP